MKDAQSNRGRANAAKPARRKTKPVQRIENAFDQLAEAALKAKVAETQIKSDVDPDRNITRTVIEPSTAETRQAEEDDRSAHTAETRAGLDPAQPETDSERAITRDLRPKRAEPLETPSTRDVPADFDPLAPCRDCNEQYDRHLPPEQQHLRHLGAYGAYLVHRDEAHPAR